MKAFPFALLFLFFLPVEMASATCSDRGGPGYRGPDGRCVGWRNLHKVCGSPPSTNCTAEMVAASAGVAALSRPVETTRRSRKAVRQSTMAPTVTDTVPLVGQASVIDADTIEIHGQRVRLAGIDAPESDQLCRDADSNRYRCGQKAANELAAFLAQRPVECIQVDRDRFRRVVAVCTVAGIDLADWLVRRGLALDWPRYSGGDYADAQKEAERAEKGMWAGSFVKPWDFRTCRRSGARRDWCSDEASKR